MANTMQSWTECQAQAGSTNSHGRTIYSILHAVRCDNTFVVSLGVTGFDLALEQDADGVFCRGIGREDGK